MKNLNEEFAGYTGTEKYYKHWCPGIVYTDGVKAVADKFKAYWLLDVVASYQPYKHVHSENFQLWEICTDNKKAVVTMKADDDKPVIIKQEIAYTDFPEGTLKLWLSNDGEQSVILLPSEY